MPILLNDLQSSLAAANVKVFTPKFFDSKLTGRGGTTAGFLSARNNPASVDPSVVTSPSDKECVRRSYRSGQTTVNRIPMNLIPVRAWEYMRKIKRPDLNDMVCVAKNTSGDEIYLCMEIQTISIEETIVPSHNGAAPITKKDFRANYICRFFTVHDKNDPYSCYDNSSVAGMGSMPSSNTYWIVYSTNPVMELQTGPIAALKQNGWSIDFYALQDYLNNYEIYDAVCARSEQWQTKADTILDELFSNLHTCMSWQTSMSTYVQMIAENVVKYIMSYNIPLDLYKHIYASIVTNFDPDAARLICKQNLNLLLSDTLGNLDANKSSIQGFTPSAQQGKALPSGVQKLSPEQMRAVISQEPLILVQAGAGTGKSTLILGRIDYLVHSGVKPEDITVLSFTNAAADNITAKNPNVHSMTIARMIHEIYTANFSDHELSSLDTIINSIDIYYPATPGTNRGIVAEFQRRLGAMVKNDTNNFTEMNNFIEEHYDEVIKVLDTIHQTSLELEIIICYQKIDSFVEPPSIASKFLIIDEVQDNSIFEFVYTLKYVDKHKESLFIVGDCSQTLYEFRASNPRALNILEGSGTFATYQLNVNYRSRQEILDFANVALQNIEANQYAQIQLQANSLAAVTEQSFLDHVWFNYHQLKKLSEFHQELAQIFSHEIRPYIEKCLQAGEQVAILAFTRKDIAAIKQILEAQYPTSSCVSLVPEKMYNTTVMSTFIKKYWNDIKFAPYSNVVNIIIREIMARLPYLVYADQKAAPQIQKMLLKWSAEEGPKIKAWVSQVSNGQMAINDMLDLIKDNMIRYEISQNAIKQSLLSAKNQQAKQDNAVQDADFLLSTIHSAKGLEFENVIVLYRNENQMDEEKKRMYYVALTRAMRSEYILAYDTMSSPQIQADYITVLEHLHALAPAAASPIDALNAKRRKNNRVSI